MKPILTAAIKPLLLTLRLGTTAAQSADDPAEPEEIYSSLAKLGSVGFGKQYKVDNYIASVIRLQSAGKEHACEELKNHTDDQAIHIYEKQITRNHFMAQLE